MYKTSVTWQCIPHHIEILFNSEHYFIEYQAFPELGPEEDSIEESIVKQIVEEMWKQFDMDGSGDLDKEETRDMLKHICAQNKKKFKEDAFESTYLLIDRDMSGKIDKTEMMIFVKSLLDE